MKKLLLVALAALVTAPAMAADLAPRVHRRPVVVAAPVYSWTGFYIGGNLGVAVNRDPTTLTTVAGPGVIIVPAGTPIYGTPTTLNLASAGVTGGAQVGYNYQFAPNWVAGIETDFQGSDLRNSTGCIVPCGAQVSIVPGIVGGIFPVIFADDSLEHHLRWFGTLRGRIGYAVGPALFYVTGGLAYADIERSANVAGITTIITGGTVNTFAGQFSTSTVRTGGTIGTGVEAQFGAGWSVKGEYLYMDFGNITDTFNTVFTFSQIGQTGLVAATRTFSSDIREHVFRIGLNYKFSNYYAPFVTK